VKPGQRALLRRGGGHNDEAKRKKKDQQERIIIKSQFLREKKEQIRLRGSFPTGVYNQKKREEGKLHAIVLLRTRGKGKKIQLRKPQVEKKKKKVLSV